MTGTMKATVPGKASMPEQCNLACCCDTLLSGALLTVTWREELRHDGLLLRLAEVWMHGKTENPPGAGLAHWEVSFPVPERTEGFL